MLALARASIDAPFKAYLDAAEDGADLFDQVGRKRGQHKAWVEVSRQGPSARVPGGLMKSSQGLMHGRRRDVAGSDAPVMKIIVQVLKQRRRPCLAMDALQFVEAPSQVVDRLVGTRFAKPRSFDPCAVPSGVQLGAKTRGVAICTRFAAVGSIIVANDETALGAHVSGVLGDIDQGRASIAHAHPVLGILVRRQLIAHPQGQGDGGMALQIPSMVVVAFP